MPRAAGEEVRVHASGAAAAGRPDVVRLLAPIAEGPLGALWRGAWGEEPVVVDSRTGPASWTPDAPPTPWLGVAGDVALPEGRGALYVPWRGELLEQALGAGPIATMPPPRALKIAIQVARALCWLHEQGRVHHGLTPDHVLLGDDDQVALLGVGHSRPLGREHSEGLDERRGESALCYLAPEQTGRVGRPADARTDLYGLGALLYRLLGGQPPAAGRDRLETMHAIIARPPAPLPIDRKLNALVGKLLAKDALDRYQTARGVLDDLERCLAAVSANLDLGQIELGSRDRSGHVVLPDALYGRDLERASLLAAYAEAEGGAVRTVLVAGVAGSGKSKLIAELRQSAEIVLWGKFDPTDGGSPYAALGRAIDAALTRALGQSDAALRALRSRVQAAVGDEIDALLPVLPRLPLLVGPVGERQRFEPEAELLRLQRATAGILRALTPDAQPIVLVIDDLQWADTATFRMLSALAELLPRLLLVGAYRLEEVDGEHPLRDFASERRAQQIELGEIDEAAVAAFVAAALSSPVAAVRDLAAELRTRTRGNPFHLRWFLRELDRRDALTRGADHAWRVELRDGEAVGVAANVAELLAGRIGELDPAVQRLLHAAAVMGTWLDPPLLATALALDPVTIEQQLGAALQAEILEALRGGGERRYRFAHDRLREAALTSIDVTQRNSLSLALGRALWQRDDADPFDVAALLNPVAADLDDTERAHLVQIDLVAADRALRARAVDAAFRLLEAAWSLLGDDPWRTHHAEALRCRDLQAEVAFQRGKPQQAIAVCSEILAKTEQGLEQSNALLLLQAVHGNSGNVKEALDACYRHFELMGEKMPRKASMGAMLLELGRAMWELRGRDIAALLDAPPMQDERKLAVLRGVSSASATVDSPFGVMQRAIRSMRLTVQHGPTRYSGFAFSTYGGMLCGPLGKMEQGDRFGRLGLELVRRFEADDIENRVLTNYYTFVAHWTHPFRDCMLGLEEAVRSARRAGDFTFLPGAMQFLTQMRTLQGGDLQAALRDARSQARELHADVHNQHRVQGYERLLELLCDPELADLDGKAAMARFEGLEHRDDQFTTVQLLSLRGAAAWYVGDLATARREFDQARPLQDALFCMPLLPWARLYDAISALEADAPGAVKLARKTLRWLRPRAKVAPFNLGHAQALIEAELAAHLGKPAQALAHYADAIEQSERNGFRLDHATARWRLAALHERAGRTAVAADERREATLTLRAIGAHGMVKRLLQRQAAMRLEAAEAGGLDVDVETLVRAGAVIASELQIDRLLARLTSLLLQNAGAQRALLITQHDGIWRVDAEEGPEGYRQPELALEGAGELLCLAAARYALRTGQVVRVDDAARSEHYRDDPYVAATSARSLLAIPLRRGGEASGLVYLENRLSAGAFDAAKVRAVSLLAGQIGFAIDNARLFDETQALKVASERFVPKQMLEVLGRGDIRHVGVGDSVEGTMTVLFSDIRRFTTLSEGLTPKETFAFVNEYLARMEPVITRHGGFIDKYIGDAIMAVFPGDADDAVRASAAMLGELATYNAERAGPDVAPLEIGIGLHRGPLMLGTVGGVNRMEGTVIGDTVNLASRVESMTKTLGIPLLVSAPTIAALRRPDAFRFRAVGKQSVRGRDEAVELFTLDR
ncbi:MAG: AAA family ATPase [Deltaproteobacteria bacterium]|nr:AAA family ATPase [Deltaproteobacteria bacterium]